MSNVADLLTRVKNAVKRGESATAITLIRDAQKEQGCIEDTADDVRAFLAGTRPLIGCCFCDDEPHYAGRAWIERLAIGVAAGDEYLLPSATQCVDILEFLTEIQPVSPELCYGCAGQGEQVGLNIVLRHVQRRLTELIEAAEAK